MLKFSEWLKQEGVRHHFLWGDDIETTDREDNLGIPLLQRPGFRPREKKLIEKQSDQVVDWLNKVTNRYGIHWEMIYLEPKEDETDSPEGFALYKKRSIQLAKEKVDDLVRNFEPNHPEEKPPTAKNTIVYVKPTSRVHPLSSHQQVHNIGHAIFGYAKKHRNEFALKLERIVERIKKRIDKMSLEFNPGKELQASGSIPELKRSIAKYTPSYIQKVLPTNQMNTISTARDTSVKLTPYGSNEDITQEEITLVIARLVNLKSMKRIFSMSPEDFADPKKAINQVYGSWDEFLYELIAAFFRGGGRINLQPQEGLKQELTPAKGVLQHPTIKNGPRGWVWKRLFEDQHFWNNVSDELTLIVVSALHECTFDKLGRPIYATYDGLPQT